MARNANTDIGGNVSEEPTVDGDGNDGRHDYPTLAEFVRDAAERGEGMEGLVERVRASYDREIPRRRVRRLVDTERERLESRGPEPVLTDHAPRYVDLDDLASLTDAEFGRVVASLLGERDGHAEVLTDGEPNEDPDEEGREETGIGIGTTDGTAIRWHRGDETVLVRAIAAEPSRVVDGDAVRRAGEHARSVHEASEHGRNEAHGHEGDTEAIVEKGAVADDGGSVEHRGYHDPANAHAAIVTVADVVPGATRLAVRSGIDVYDRTDVRRWFDEVKMPLDAFGSLIEDA